MIPVNENDYFSKDLFRKNNIIILEGSVYSAAIVNKYIDNGINKLKSINYYVVAVDNKSKQYYLNNDFFLTFFEAKTFLSNLMRSKNV